MCGTIVKVNPTVATSDHVFLSLNNVHDRVTLHTECHSERLRAPYTAMWHTVQQRLEQYAATGAGTVAEAIVYNDYWWNGQLAHEEPSGGKSRAVKRRRSSGC
eukprot:13734-Heterococcus_DN1.PRE.1